MAKKQTLGQKLSKAFSPQETISKPAAAILGICMFVVVILAWYACTKSGAVDPMFLPSPEKQSRRV